MSDASSKPPVAIGTLSAFAQSLLMAGGFQGAHAAQTADLLVWADARGIESHGVLRIPRYVEMVRLGLIDARAVPHVVSEFGAMSVLEGASAPGAAVMTTAMDRAIALARTHAIGWCSARNITHAGAVGYFAAKAAAADCIGIVMTASRPLMTYYGSSAEALSTNPLAIAAPNPKGGDPVILDMSTSAVALGKIMAAKAAGRSIPTGWAIDAEGVDTTDPNTVASLLPMAGPKGSGLSLMIEVLASVLVANPIISTALNKTGKAAFNGVAMALDIRAFGDVATFHEDMARLSAAIKSLPKAADVDVIRLPGERAAVAGRRSADDGIRLEVSTASKLVSLAKELGVAVPHGLDRTA